MFILVAGPQAWAESIYDPSIAARYRTATTDLDPAGGEISLPPNDGISVRLTYPKNDACTGTKLTISGLGPTGIPHLMFFDTTFTSGWKPFYVLLTTVSSGCASNWLTFFGEPQLYVDISEAGSATHYYMDLALELGSTTHVPLGPPDQRDPTHIRFDFGSLPYWARENGYVRVPITATMRMILGRQ